VVDNDCVCDFTDDNFTYSDNKAINKWDNLDIGFLDDSVNLDTSTESITMSNLLGKEKEVEKPPFNKQQALANI
jgi:hypothetical protein